MSDLMCPGPVRLFSIEPDDRIRVTYRVIGHDAREIATGHDLTVAVVIAATTSISTARPVWVSSPDRWACCITRTTEGFVADQEVTAVAAPLDAIRRVLALITITPTGDIS
jgi:hypothetical protein